MNKRRISKVEGETGLEPVAKTQEIIDLERYVDIFTAVTNHIQNFSQFPDVKQREIASRLGMAESQLSKWLSGFQNLTLKSLIKLEAVSNIGLLNPVIFGKAKKVETTNIVFFQVFQYPIPTEVNQLGLLGYEKRSNVRSNEWGQVNIKHYPGYIKIK